MEETEKTGRELLKMVPGYVSHVWKRVGSVFSNTPCPCLLPSKPSVPAVQNISHTSNNNHPSVGLFFNGSSLNKLE